ncbi:MAG TPA: hypothetical protein VF909_09445 [Roseiflexaceae bacterium]
MRDKPSRPKQNKTRRTTGRGAGVDFTRRQAFLIFDSQDQYAFAGARAVAMPNRRLLFQSGPTEIDLEIVADPRGCKRRITGQVQVKTGEWPSAVTFQHVDRRYVAAIDGCGEFELEGLRQGDYAIAVDFDDWGVIVPQISI